MLFYIENEIFVLCLDKQEEKQDVGNEKPSTATPMDVGVAIRTPINDREDYIVGVHTSTKVDSPDKSSLTDLSGSPVEMDVITHETGNVTMDVGDKPSDVVHRDLFQIRPVSQYGSREPTELSRDKIINFRRKYY